MKRLFPKYKVGCLLLQSSEIRKFRISSIDTILNYHLFDCNKNKKNLDTRLSQIQISGYNNQPIIRYFNYRNISDINKTFQYFNFSTKRSRYFSNFDVKKKIENISGEKNKEENMGKLIIDNINDIEENKDNESFIKESEKNNFYSSLNGIQENSMNCSLNNKKNKKKKCFDQPEEKNLSKNDDDLIDETQRSYISNNFKQKENKGNKKIIPRSEIRKIVKDEDLIVMKKVRGSGPGGQHLNKTSSAVYLKDTTTNIAIKVSNSRDSIVNEGIARKRLIDKLDQFYNGKDSKLEKKNEKIRKQKSKAMKRSAEKHSKNNNSNE